MLRDDIERQVGRINGEFGEVGRPVRALPAPAHLRARNWSRSTVAADVMLVTPLRDGMNLVAKEYVACRSDLGGALVLSEFTGAAAELRQAYLVNPHDLDGVKDAIERGAEPGPRGGPTPDARAAPSGARPRRRPVGTVIPRRAGGPAEQRGLGQIGVM